LLLLGVLTACTPSETQTPTGSSSAVKSETPDDKPVTITWWDWNPHNDNFRKNVISKFEEKHKNITVEMTSFQADQYHTALVTAIQGGEAPDIIATRGEGAGELFADIIDMGALEPLDGLIDVSAFDEDIVNIGKWKGKLYNVPTGIGHMLGIFYNRDQFAEAGITKLPKSVAEFESAMDALKEAGFQPFAFGGGNWVYCLFSWEIAMDSANEQDWVRKFVQGEASLAESKKLPGVFNLFVDWGKRGYFGDNYEAMGYEAAFLAFSSQQGAMVVSGTWDYDTVKTQNPDINMGFLYFPSESGTVYSNPMPWSLYGMSSKTKNRNAALSFLNFTISVEGIQARFDIGGGIPVIDGIDVGDNKFIQEVVDYDELVLSGHSNIFPSISFSAKEMGAPENYLQAKSSLVFAGTMTPEEFIAGLDELLDRGKLPRPILK
jgi:raffinose/stachyose/melibiose transport system substrate-binding protein